MRTVTKLLLVIISIVLMLINVSCKKEGYVIQDDEIDSSPIEKRFLSEHRTKDPAEKALVGFISRANDKEHFIEKTTKQIGYPRWDRAFVISKSSHSTTSSLQSNLVGDSSKVYFIPFVRDSQNFVNAVMIINAFPTDTSFTYKCDWQYHQLLNKTTSGKDQAENFAVFFMVLNKAVFGYTKFLINDKKIFKSGNDNPIYVSLDSVDNRKNNFYEYVGFCLEVEIFFNNCQYFTQNNDNITGPCSWTERNTYCWEELVDIGGGSGGGSSGGGTSSGGGSSGGSTPPECDGQPIPFSKDKSNVSNFVEPVSDPCSGGWTPVSDQIVSLGISLDLNNSQRTWLQNHPSVTDALFSFLADARNEIDPLTNSPYLPGDNPEAVIAATSGLQAAMAGILETGFGQSHFNLLISSLNSPYNQTSFDPMWVYYFSLECINLKEEHPEWSNTRVYLEASLEVVHIILDAAGMVPVIGEIADLANGGLYTLQGDGVNAAFSYAAVIPFAGWASTTAKYARKVITAVDGSKRALKWLKNVAGIINFGDRRLLRKVLGLPVGDPRVAHHLVPWEHGSEFIIQKAAGKNFHLNELLNGIPLTTVQHSGSHAVYNQKVLEKLNTLWQVGGGAAMDGLTAQGLVRKMVNDMRNWIVAHPNESINDIIIP